MTSKEKHINPFTVVYDKDREVWREIGRTEIMLDNKWYKYSINLLFCIVLRLPGISLIYIVLIKFNI